MNAEQFADKNGVIFEYEYLKEAPDEEIIYDWNGEILNEQAE